MHAISLTLPVVTGPALIGLISGCLIVGVMDALLKALERRFFPAPAEV